jgi:beta-hydroxyacyl-ACP dehydratase FabZ
MGESETPSHLPLKGGRTEISASEVLAILPHRFPFLMIDRVRQVDDEKIVAVKNVSWGEPYFQGHFPGMPVMPGVLQVEAMAQAGGIFAHQSGGFDPETQVMFFMSIDKVKFRKPVTPGDQLVIEVVPLRRGKIWKMRGEVRVDGEVVSEAEFVATMAPRP